MIYQRRKKKENFKFQTNCICRKTSNDILEKKDDIESNLIVVLNNFKININHIFNLNLIKILFIEKKTIFEN